jgi:hypothetical protein
MRTSRSQVSVSWPHSYTTTCATETVWRALGIGGAAANGMWMVCRSLVAALALAACVLCSPFACDGATITDIPAHGLILPTAVAPYGKGRYVVADAALQRIFVVAEDGTTTTLAGGGEPNALGSVPGGFADGRGGAARFDAPQGIATDARGVVYVADTENHCIRKITPQGTVTTFAGDPGRPDKRDGPAMAAGFRAPRGMVFDVNGDLLVADAFVGVRRISRSGKVSTLPIPVNLPFDIAVVRGVNRQPLYVVSDNDGLLAFTNVKAFVRYTLENVARKDGGGTPSGDPIGHPYNVAAYGSHSVVYTDRVTNEVRILDTDLYYVKSIVSSPDVGTIRLGEPVGVRPLPDGRGVVVADGLNGELRVLDLDSDREPFIPSGVAALPPPPDRSKQRIALVGSSMIWWATDWQSSIEGQAEALLNAQPHTRPVEVLPVLPLGATAAAQLQYAGDLCEAHDADVIVLNVNSALVRESYSVSGAISSSEAWAKWAGPIHNSATATNSRCRSAGVRFAIAISPLSDEISASEEAVRRLLNDVFVTDPAAHASYLAALDGVPVIDTWTAFAAAESSNHDRAPLYFTWDTHLSAAGRTVFAGALADAIERL